MRITINGNLGSGKSTVGRLVAEQLKVPYYSAGQLFREIGHIQNLDALRTNLAAENNVEIDQVVDRRTAEIDTSVESFVLDSRMAWHFVHNAVNVFLSVSIDTAASRILGDKSRRSEAYASVAEATASLRDRRASEVARYANLYKVNIEDVQNYDLFVITDGAEPADIARVVIAYCDSVTRHKFWIPKKRIVPMIGISEASGVKRAAGVRFADKAVLPVAVQQNYGFYFDGAVQLIAMMHHESPVVPFQDETPQSARNEQDDLMSLALNTLSTSDLHGWQDATGVSFDFMSALQAHGATPPADGSGP
jgi:CMP/dCMP kinase